MISPRTHQGSIPLALLVIIVVGGVVVTLFSVVRLGTQTAGRDRDFAAAIQVADAGIQDAYLMLLSLTPEELEDPSTVIDCTPPPGAPTPTPSGGICQVPLEDGGYTFSFERRGADVRSWNVESWGDYRGSTRMVAANIGTQRLFATAILSVDSLLFSGGGITAAGGQCNIEQFGIGAQGAIELTGNTGSCISRIVVFNSEVDHPNSDYGVFANDCEDVAEGEEVDLEQCGLTFVPNTDLTELPNHALEAFQTGECSNEADRISALPAVLQRGETYCISGNVDTSGTHTVSGDGDEVVVHVQGSLTFGAGSSVNEGGPAGDLLFNVGGGNVRIRSTSNASAAIWAPAAACHSQGGAGPIGSFSGAMTCGSVHISGNWTYDSSVEGISSTDFSIRNWAERPPRGGPPTSS